MRDPFSLGVRSGSMQNGTPKSHTTSWHRTVKCDYRVLYEILEDDEIVLIHRVRCDTAAASSPPG